MRAPRQAGRQRHPKHALAAFQRHLVQEVRDLRRVAAVGNPFGDAALRVIILPGVADEHGIADRRPSPERRPPPADAKTGEPLQDIESVLRRKRLDRRALTRGNILLKGELGIGRAGELLVKAVGGAAEPDIFAHICDAVMHQALHKDRQQKASRRGGHDPQYALVRHQRMGQER